MEIRTNRLILKQWTENLREPFAQMNTDAAVMADLGGPYNRAKSDRKFDRYRKSFDEDGLSRWALIDSNGEFVGYAGVIKSHDLSHPLGRHFDIGWRLHRNMWGQGYATEASLAALTDGFERCKMKEIVSYTDANNSRSQAVMERIGLIRDKALDFSYDYGLGALWSGLVWRTSSYPNRNLEK